MNNQPSIDTRASWTWADQISTYRFWGLLIFYLLSAVSVTILSTFLAIFLKEEAGMKYTKVGILFVLMGIGGLFGFYLAWATTRWKTVPMLIVAGLLQLMGGLLITIPGLAAVVILSGIGAFTFGLGAGVITLTIPSVIAGGRGGGEAFVITFGIIFILTRIEEMFAPTSMGALWDRYGSSLLGVTIGICLFLGLLFLLPVKHSLFNEAPPPRGYPLTPTYRDPLIVFLSCLIPFYWLYWLYRAHGEVTALAPSRSILSPRAAVLASVFAPVFVYPITLTKLNDALNSHATELGQAPYRASWVIFWCACLLNPLGMALVQSSMNRVMAGAGQPQ